VGSAVGLVIGLVVLRGWGVGAAEAADLTPSRHWAEPAVAVEPAPDDGPVLVTLAYRIDPARAAEFHAAMQALGRVRRRDGAFRWRLFRDPGDPARYLECFLVNSWAEHLRQHERVTVADRGVEDRARAFHVGDSPPVVSHFIDASALRD
jgi:hypothetical protein